MVASGLFRQVACDWGLIPVFRAFSGGIDCVLGGFRVSVAPLGLLWASIRLWGRDKGWDGDVSYVRFSESFCCLGLWGRTAVF